MPAEEAQELAELRVVVLDYVGESLASFVTGSRNTGSDWKAYLGELDSLGMPRMLALIQKAYDAQYK
jgi:putative aldouronate transport system substrate-binding protein